MKKQIIATVVGAVILFIWQFISWGMQVVHANEMKYTPNQDAILADLEDKGLEEGYTYFLPTFAPGDTDYDAYKEKYLGKPWATISYHNSIEDNMPMNLTRGFIVDVVAIFLLVWLLGKVNGLDVQTGIFSAVAIGGIAYLTIPYTNHIWFENPTIGHLIDAIVPWAIIGAWLGWFLTKK